MFLFFIQCGTILAIIFSNIFSALTPSATPIPYLLYLMVPGHLGAGGFYLVQRRGEGSVFLLSDSVFILLYLLFKDLRTG